MDTILTRKYPVSEKEFNEKSEEYRKGINE